MANSGEKIWNKIFFSNMKTKRPANKLGVNNFKQGLSL